MTDAFAPAPGTITMYGADWCRDCRRTEALLNDLGVEWTKVDVEASAEAAAQAQAISGRTNIPVVVFPDGSHLVEPSDDAVREKLSV
jgi:glutaredoxin